MFEFLDKRIRKMKWWDISLIKLSVFFATLTILNLWPAFMKFVSNANVLIFIVLTLIFMTRQVYLSFKR